MSGTATIRTFETQGGEGFLRDFRVQREPIRKAQVQRGIPSLRYAIDAAGKTVLVRSWSPISRQGDADLEGFWFHELRQLRRLSNLVGGSDKLVQLAEAGIDDTGFHLVCSIGRRRLLADWIDAAPAASESRSSDSRRALLWRNLARIARALSILHSQGLTHRNLDEYSILTENGPQPDFQLAGFEWATRLVPAPALLETDTSFAQSSFADQGFSRDWRDLGRLAGRLFHVDEARLTNPAIPSGDVIPGMRSQEIAILRQLRAFTWLTGGRIADDMDGVASVLELAAHGRSTTLNLLLPLGKDNALTRAIQSASGGLATIIDVEAQRAFVEQDLAGDARALALASRAGNEFQLALRGRLLNYVVHDYTHPNTGPSQWVLAFCGRATSVTAWIPEPLNQVPLSDLSVSVLTENDPYSSNLVPQSGAWNSLRARVDPYLEDDNSQDLLAQGFLLNQIVQGLVAAANEFPVETVAPPAGFKASRDRNFLHVRPRRDEDREKLASLLGYKSTPGARLHETLMGESFRPTDTWRLFESGDGDEEDEAPTEWEFIRERSDQLHGGTYSFVGDEPAPRLKKGFLVPADAAGSTRQFRRQIKAWRSLCDQGELLHALANPRRAMKRLHEAVIEDETFLDLDADKQSCLRAALRTAPHFLVQGPPGVGKTHLVSELARQLVRASPCARIVFAAQSHAAVDHLLSGVAKNQLKSQDGRPLIVRARAQEAGRTPNEYDLSAHVTRIADALLRSPLLKRSTERLRRQVTALAANGVAGSAPQDELAASRRFLLRPVESLIVRAANLLFSTVNAAALEQLVDDRAQFDWSIIEEAAKATGTELLNALLLAPRRLMIGDHRQLPPFDAARATSLLGDPPRLAKLLTIAERLGGRNIYDSDLRGLLRAYGDADSADPAELQQLCEVARHTLLLFENLIEDTQEDSPNRIDISRMLALQHRMHPTIARVVSHAFYDDKLNSAERCIQYFSTESPPVRCIDLTWASDKPITWIDLPWLQEGGHPGIGERRPGPWNPGEITALLRVIVALEPAAAHPEARPSMALLTPYRAQVEAIERAIERADSSLRTRLNAFTAIGGSYVHTVDSFQGNEADVVIISLVRNNHRGSLIGALGFLADERRMNVLLSRARWRMAIVGSWRFLEDVVSRHTDESGNTQAQFLQRFMHAIRQAEREGLAAHRPGLVAARSQRQRRR